MNIFDFLSARITEDFHAPEAEARRAASPAPWDEVVVEQGRLYDVLGNDITKEYERWQQDLPLAESAVRWRAECTAKWLIVNDARALPDDVGSYFAVRYLAAVYADHPDYNPEWRLP